MRKGQIRNIFFSLFLLSSVAMLGQKSMGIDEVIKLVLENNIDITKANNDFRFSKNTQFTSYVDLFPKARLTGLLYTSEGNNFDEISGQLIQSKGDFASTDITLYWDILNVVSKAASVKSANNYKKSSEWNVESVKDDILLRTILAYLELLQTKSQKDILDGFVDVQNQTLKETQQLINLGRMPGLDEQIQQTELTRLKSAQTENARIINEKRNQLFLFLGITPETSTEFQDINMAFLEKAKTFENASIDSLYQIALESRNALKSMNFNVRGMKSDINVERGEYYPKLNLFYRIGYAYSSFNQRSFNDQFFIDNRVNSYGVELVLPIFNGMRQRNKVFEKRMQYENAIQDYTQLKKQIYVQISDAKSSIRENERKFKFRQDQVRLSKSTYELQKERYVLGVSTVRELAITYRDFLEASLLESQAKYQLTYSKYELLYYLGKIRL
jgi:outer membrane protein